MGLQSKLFTYNLSFFFLIGLSFFTFVSAFPNTNSYYPNYTETDAVDYDFPYSPTYKSHRNSKLFPLFTIIRFTNEVCRVNEQENGVCFTRTQCVKNGGNPVGSCAQGLGVCCQFIAECGSVVRHNGTAFRNPNFPSKFSVAKASDVCQVRIRKQKNICQLRLNFINFDIDGPAGPGPMQGGAAGQNPMNDAGNCKTDSMAITSSSGMIPSLCGVMTGQHIYVEYGSSDTVTINMLLSGNAPNKEREWNIEILMIPCNAVSRAPSGCLQYFQGVSGQIRSFNFEGGTHLARMDYTSCVRLEDGMRSIEWSACQTGEVRFAGPSPLLATALMCGTAFTMHHDYLTIVGGIQFPQPATPPAGTLPGTSVTDRFCDVHFVQPTSFVRTVAKPFGIHFRTNEGEIPETAAGMNANDASLGFCLRWQQSVN